MLKIRQLFSREIWKIIIVVVFYWIISIATVFINKLVMSGDTIRLDAPFFITWFQCLVSALSYFCYDLVFSERRDVKSPFHAQILKSVFPLSFVFVSMIAFNNLCLKNVDVSFYFIGRSLTTVFNVILTYLILNQTTSFKTCVCCAFIIFGFWLGVDQEQIVGSISISGTIYGVLASLSVAYYSIKLKEVLPRVDSVIWRLNYYNNVYSCLTCLPLIVLAGEVPTLINWELLAHPMAWIWLSISGLTGLLIGLASSLQIKVTSPLTHNISGTAKACAQTVLASYYYDESKTLLWWISNWIVLIGSALYARVKQLEMVAKSREILIK